MGNKKKILGLSDFFVSVIGFILFILLILFLPAGTLKFTGGWIYIVLQLTFVIIYGFYFQKKDKQLLKKRMSIEKPKLKWDKNISLFIVLFVTLLFIFSGLDFRYGISNISNLIKTIGFIFFSFGLILFFLVSKENTYLSKNVEIQKSRKQKVITTGPYSIVRHPMYLGVILYLIFLPIALGSLLGLIPSILSSSLVLVRANLEDKFLQKNLAGYKKYAGVIKYRLIPYIW